MKKMLFVTLAIVLILSGCNGITTTCYRCNGNIKEKMIMQGNQTCDASHGWTTIEPICSSSLDINTTPTIFLDTWTGWKGWVGVEIPFYARVINGYSPYTYIWDFGDGTTIIGERYPNHAFTTAGNKNVTITIIDSYGTYGSETFTVPIYEESAGEYETRTQVHIGGAIDNTLATVTFVPNKPSSMDGDWIVRGKWHPGQVIKAEVSVNPGYAFLGWKGCSCVEAFGYKNPVWFMAGNKIISVEIAIENIN